MAGTLMVQLAPSELVPTGRESLIFDVDASQYASQGGSRPCTVCGVYQQIIDAPRAFVRIRRRVEGGSREHAWLCPDCVGRAMIQVQRCKLWDQMSAAVRGTLRRMFNARRKAARNA